jgi:hypothetical protein
LDEQIANWGSMCFRATDGAFESFNRASISVKWPPAKCENDDPAQPSWYARERVMTGFNVPSTPKVWLIISPSNGDAGPLPQGFAAVTAVFPPLRLSAGGAAILAATFRR